jgi:hypothetical protein
VRWWIVITPSDFSMNILTFYSASAMKGQVERGVGGEVEGEEEGEGERERER